MAVMQSFDGGFDNVIGRLEIRLSDAEVDHIVALGFQGFGAGQNLECGLGSET